MKGIIFDFNGTLIFDRQAHEDSWHHLIPKLRGTGFSENEFKEHVHGRTNREIFSYVFDKELTEKEAEVYGEEKESLYRTYLVKDKNACSLVQGLESFFDALKEMNIPMAIATASPASNVAFYRERFHLDQWFAEDHIIYADGTMPGKPDPAIFNKAIEVLGLPAHECIIVEDSPLGIRAAIAAGAGRVIGIWANEEVLAELDQLPLYKKIQNYDELDMEIFK